MMSTEENQITDSGLSQVMSAVTEGGDTPPEALQKLFGRTSFNYEINKARTAGVLVPAPGTIQ